MEQRHVLAYTIIALIVGVLSIWSALALRRRKARKLRLKGIKSVRAKEARARQSR